MAARFGLTWWGQAWLNSLTGIDYENRIPRGLTYARNGSVLKVTRTGNIFQANVQGTRRRPYKVTLVLPKFAPEDVNRLIDKVISRPALLTQLLNRELLPEMLEIAKSCGLRIFPERWSDLKMMCDCPDWAVPCKHIAAVVYMISREIDNDPFLVFEMHGLDLIGELEKRGLSLRKALEDKEVTPAKNAFSLYSTAELKEQEAAHKTVDAKALAKIDFSRLVDRLEATLMVLPPSPPFYTHGDFKELYASELHRVAKAAERLLSGKAKADAAFRVIGEPQPIDIDTELAVSLAPNLDWAIEPGEWTVGSLAASLMAINPDFLPDYAPQTASLRTCLLASIHLAAKGLLEPRILLLPDKQYIIRWFPAMRDPAVAELVVAIQSGIPSRLLAYAKGKRPQYIADSAEWLISMFASELVKQSTLYREADEVHLLFFGNCPQPFGGIGQASIPGAIKVWIEYSMTDAQHWRPAIIIGEEGEEFSLNISLEDPEKPHLPPVTLWEIMTNDIFAADRLDILQTITRLTHLMPAVSAYVNDYGRAPIVYTLDQLPKLLFDIVPAMRLLGMKVYLPKSLQHLLRPKVSMMIDERDESSPKRMSVYDFFDYKWQVAIGDEAVSAEEFERLLANASGLIRFKKSFFYITEQELQRLRKSMQDNRLLTPTELFRTAISEDYEGAPVTLTDSARRLLKKFREVDSIEAPKGLQATLRPYQLRGLSWLHHNLTLGFGSILADDMGLGKTLQTIALLQKLKEEGALGAVLVVVPVGLISNWQAEFTKFAPSLTVGVHHGTARILPKKLDTDVLITSYGVARSDGDKLKKLKWQIVIIDEAQNIKNHKTAQAQAIAAIPAQTHIALSGTPVENRLSEYWSIMNFVNKGYLGTLKEFNTDYAMPIQIDNSQDAADKFRRVTAPFMMRRLKTDKSIISDLPDKIEGNVYAPLTKEQAAIYEQTLSEAMAVIEGLPTTDPQSLFKRQAIILQMIMALKQICNHPAQFLKNGDLRAEISGKAMMLLDRVQSIVENGCKVIIFTQFREMGDIIVKLLEERLGRRPMFLHGGCSIKERREMVDRFQNKPADKVFVLSLKAAGTGLNLTAASHVIHYDLWWNPAVEAQATDRAYRIGQHNNVIVDRFITRGTFEEKINDIIESKRHLAEMTVASGESWLGHLSNSELREIFG